MKKLRIDDLFDWKDRDLILRKMKLTFLFSFLVFMCSWANSFSQGTKLSLKVTNVPVQDVIQIIEDQTDYYFLYQDEVFNKGQQISIQSDNEPIDKILKKLAEQANITYEISDRQIILKRKVENQQGADQVVKKISGIVTNVFGEPLPGVTIFIKGTTTGTITNIDGYFNLEKVPAYSVLVVSFVGMKTIEIPVSGSQQFSIVLEEDVIGIEEVVAVGYGTQKKENLTGAVDQIGNAVFANRPMPNITRGLEGVIPNLNISMGDGKPMRSSSYNVRGTTSIGGGGNALVLIDGIPGDPNLLNPSDIESVSVLKDAASAAIYGARGSFGVVLITTKHPKDGKVQINYSGSLSFNDRTIKPDLVTDGYDWAKTFDDAYSSWNDYATHPQKVNSVFPFSLDYLDELKKRHDDPGMSKIDINPTTGEYVYYGSTDWLKELYTSVMPATEHSLSVSGSKDKMSFYLSGHYMGQGGIFRYNTDKYRMYNLRAKGSVQALKWLRVENDFSLSVMTYFTPILNHPSETPVYRRISDEAFPIAMLKNPDGTLTQNASIVFGSFISGNNYQDYKNMEFNNTSRFVIDISKNLSVSGDFTYKYRPNQETDLYTPVPYSKKPGEILERGESKIRYWDKKTDYKGANVYANFKQSFGNHTLEGVVGYNYENSFYKNIYIQRYGVINPELPDFSLIDGENLTLQGGGNEWTTMGGFFRLNYNFSNRYLFEVNGRYDGSSKFPEKQQFGFFPSFSGAWRISEEPFWKIDRDRVSNLKLRASYGSLGNGNVLPYQFLETMAVSKSSVIINGSLPNYTSMPNVIPDGLTWEKVTSANVGIDIGLFDNRFTTTFDYYNRFTIGMFTTGTPLPSVFGASVPKGNYADLKTKGWELSIQWGDEINSAKPIKYDIRFILADNVAFITKYNNPQKLIGTYYEGSRVGDIWGFETEGFFTDPNDIATHANQSYVRVSAANRQLPGDIKFRDLDDNKVINLGKSTVDDPGDQKIIGNDQPRYHFGLTTNAEWNNFFFSVFFQGVGRRDFWPGTDASLFWGAYNRPYSFHPKYVEDNMWSEENPDTYFPRLRGYAALNSRAELTLVQSKYLQNAAYVRLKNLTFGYNLPKSLVNKASFSSVKIYFTGQNLWVYSPMFKHGKNMDPEVIDGADPELNANSGNGMRYPMLKTFTLGINITF